MPQLFANIPLLKNIKQGKMNGLRKTKTDDTKTKITVLCCVVLSYFSYHVLFSVLHSEYSNYQVKLLSISAPALQLFTCARGFKMFDDGGGVCSPGCGGGGGPITGVDIWTDNSCTLNKDDKQHLPHTCFSKQLHVCSITI